MRNTCRFKQKRPSNPYLFSYCLRKWRLYTFTFSIRPWNKRGLPLFAFEAQEDLNELSKWRTWVIAMKLPGKVVITNSVSNCETTLTARVWNVISAEGRGLNFYNNSILCLYTSHYPCKLLLHLLTNNFRSWKHEEGLDASKEASQHVFQTEINMLPKNCLQSFVTQSKQLYYDSRKIGT